MVGAAGVSARHFARPRPGRDARAPHRRNGSVSGQVNLTSFAVLALRGAGVAPSRRTLAWLVRQQNHDGGFGFAGGGSGSDVDDTGATLEALAGVRVAGAAAPLAGGRLHAPPPGSRRRVPVPAGRGIQCPVDGLGDPGARCRRRESGLPAPDGSISPLAYLRGLIAANGSIDYARGVSQTPVWVTGEALMALEGKPLPLAPVSVRAATPRRRRRRRTAPPAPQRAAARPRTPSPRLASGHRARDGAAARRDRARVRPARRVWRAWRGGNRYPAPPHEDRCPEGDCRR